MDLMIDCMPLYEMIEDDMKNIATLHCSSNSSSSSPSCLSDEEQLALSSCTSLLDDLFFFQPTVQPMAPSTPSQSNTSCISTSYVTNGTNNNSCFQLHHQQHQQQQQEQHQMQFNTSNNNPNSNFNSTSIPSISINDMTSNTMSLTSDLAINSIEANINSTNGTYSLNNSYNSVSSTSLSSIPSYSSLTSSPSSSSAPSSASSPLNLSFSSSSLCAALANTTFGNNQSPTSSSSSSACSSASSSSLSSPIQTATTRFDDFNYQQSMPSLKTSPTTGASATNRYMQDPYYNNNYNLFQVINPLDINRSYTNHQQHQLQHNQVYHQSQSMNGYDNDDNGFMYHKQPSSTLKSTTSLITNRPVSLAKMSNSCSNGTYAQIKRGKFSHPTTITSLSSTQQQQQIKQESLNSDGESNENNDSNSSNENDFSSAASTPVNHVANLNRPPKHLIVATKIEPFMSNLSNSTNGINGAGQCQLQLQHALNVNAPSTQINVIKIANPIDNTMDSSGLKLPTLTTKTTSNGSTSETTTKHKTIIQYKQILANNLNTTASLKTSSQLNRSATVNSHSNSSSTCSSPMMSNDSNGVSSNGPVKIDGKIYPKPPYSYSCLIAMALRNSDSGNLPVSDIYDFIIENFPYYKTARDGWKNSIRHNLSLNKCFEKIENPTNGSKKGCLWALNPDKCKKLEEECKRCRQRDPVNIKLSMSRPDDLNKIERGEQRIKKFSNQNNSSQRKTTDNQLSGSSINNQNQTTAAKNSSEAYLMEWANSKNQIKEDNQTNFYEDLGNSDIKFDPILLSTVSPGGRGAI